MYVWLLTVDIDVDYTYFVNRVAKYRNLGIKRMRMGCVLPITIITGVIRPTASELRADHG